MSEGFIGDRRTFRFTDKPVGGGRAGKVIVDRTSTGLPLDFKYTARRIANAAPVEEKQRSPIALRCIVIKKKKIT
jgi:hypothetical protein